MSDHVYRIKEEKQDPKESVIEKSNVKVEFTIYDMEADERQWSKMVKEFEAQKQLSEAKMSNIEANHSFVKDLTDEQTFVVHMYEEAKAMSRVLGPKIEEIKKALIESAAEREEIIKQIGIAVPLSELNTNGKGTQEN